MGQWRRQGRDNQELSVKIVDRQIAYQTDDDDDDDEGADVANKTYSNVLITFDGTYTASIKVLSLSAHKLTYQKSKTFSWTASQN